MYITKKISEVKQIIENLPDDPKKGEGISPYPPHLRHQEGVWHDLSQQQKAYLAGMLEMMEFLMVDLKVYSRQELSIMQAIGTSTSIESFIQQYQEHAENDWSIYIAYIYREFLQDIHG